MVKEKRHLYQALVISAIWIIILWIIWIMSAWSGINLSNWGIRPRSWDGLIGIFTSPWIHAPTYDHLLSNSIPLFILSSLILYFYRSISLQLIIGAIIITGLWVWAAARPSYHIGASGIIYAFAFFLFFSGVFRKDKVSLAISLLVAFLYGGMVWGILPTKEYVSWESHLFGALAGILLAFYYRKEVIRQETIYSWQIDDTQDSGEWDYKNNYNPPEGFKYPDS